MEPTPATLGDGGQPLPGQGDSRLWLLPLYGLVGWHLWMTLGLFGADRPWEALLDDRPLVSGRHPLHLYHGTLGARAFLRRGRLSCYDPAFQAGYPKTPVFDSGSRPAELCLTFVGGEFRPAAYKLGLATCWLLAPFALLLAARGAGLNRRASLLAVLLGLAIWWGRPCRQALEEGELDLLLAGLAAVAHAGLLIRFDRRPRGRDWLGLVVVGFLGWFAHPLLFALLLPLFFLYYLSVGARHRVAWNLLLLCSVLVALGLNTFWLGDWVRYWWLRVPLVSSEQRLAHRTLSTLWNADLWGVPLDRDLAVLLLGLGVVGAVALNQAERRATARLFGLSALALLALAVGGILSDPLGRLCTPGLLVPGLLLAAPLGAHALEEGWRLAVRRTGGAPRSGLLLVTLVAGAVFLARPHFATLAARGMGAEPLPLGLTPAQEQVVEELRARTTSEARILWEDRPRAESTGRWSALLPLLTERPFVGGLDPEASIEHTADGLAGQALVGRPLGDWTDGELAEYCWRYNIGWVVCWSPASVQRFEHWSKAKREFTFEDGQGVLFTLNRPRTFVLKGKATWLKAEVDRVVLSDVQPVDGEVVLSLHYQEGLTVSPSRVKVDGKRDHQDSIALIRLRVDAPVARVTLTWER
jgi:hypothetical protein